MPQLTQPADLPPPPFNQTGSVFVNSSIRQTVHATIGGRQIRVRISNAFGVNDLPVTAATIALPVSNAAGTNAIISASVQTLTFGGNSSIIIPDGGLAVSDPLGFNANTQTMVTITIFLAQGQQGNLITSHPSSLTTSWFSVGNQVNAPAFTDPSTKSAAHWYFISALEVWVPSNATAFAIIGDSITDGIGSDTDHNNRWPDAVFAKMQKTPSVASIALLSLSATGNRVLEDSLPFGPNAVGRIDRDVLSQRGIKYAMIFDGLNDIGMASASADVQQVIGDRLIQAYKQIAARVHTFGIPLFAGTITPFLAFPPYADPQKEVTRQRVNAFIRTSGIFEAVIDFDGILKDPANATQLNPTFNSGDFLHPNAAGYQAVANAFDISIFTTFANGVVGFN
ncbi:hypothetical protein GALMADRAFT_255141 [Galerina marginata CBS 339.88]|uniref:SGNH hydrolase-type esterase domain-containing protein n=1 Tax=Galerina marginata (strain CBS 339.88) TaxID=685588 RepID=A0A067SJP3_GALM3|nr:hypothetical protein GALMADRAFT_255141 [Galerina marginata CBS 339.88]